MNLLSYFAYFEVWLLCYKFKYKPESTVLTIDLKYGQSISDKSNLHFLRVTPSVEGCTEVSDWSGFLNSVPGLLDVLHFLLDLSSSSFGDFDLEHVLGGFDIYLIR